MKKLNTNKRYYNRYWYKLEFLDSLAHIFRDKNYAYAQSCLETIEQDYNSGKRLLLHNRNIQTPVSEQQLFDSKKLLYIFKNTDVDFTIRIEHPIVNIYCDQEDFLENIAKTISTPTRIYTPKLDIKELLGKSNRVVIVKTPTDYKFRVTLKNNVPVEFGNWIQNNQDKIKIGKRALESVLRGGYCGGYYFYVKTEKVLQLLNIMIGQNIQRVEEVIVDPSIDK